MSLRVLQLIPTLDRGGAEKQMALLAAGLPRSRFDVHVCTLTRGGPWEEMLGHAGVPVSHLGKRFKFDPLALARLVCLLRTLRPQIIHTWLFAANCYGRVAARWAGVPHVVAGERCVDRWKLPYEFWIDRWLARRTERLVTNSAAVRDFCSSHGLPAEKFTVIPNGVLPAPPVVSSRAEILAELGLPPEARLIGSVGRLWPQKRYKDLMWALDLVAIVYDDVHLVIAGEGPQRWRLERFRGQMERNDKIHFLGEREDVGRLLPHFDVFSLASGYEGQSNALLEAMAAGVPVVASNIPGNRELVQHEQTGLLFPVGDRGALGRQIRRLLDDSPLAQRLAQAARARVQAEFGVAQMVARHAALYEQLAGA